MDSPSPQDLAPSAATRADRVLGWLRFAVPAAVLASGAWALRHFGLLQRLPEALDWFRSLGPWGAVVFVVAYVLACVGFLPASLLTLGAGALFGVALGTLCVSVGATLGATASFLIGRFLARDWVARRLGSNHGRGHPPMRRRLSRLSRGRDQLRRHVRAMLSAEDQKVIPFLQAKA